MKLATLAVLAESVKFEPMGSTRILIPDRPGSQAHIKRIEETAVDHGHQTDVRPVGDEWVVVVTGDVANNVLDDLYRAHVYLEEAGPDGRVSPMPPSEMVT